MKRIFCALPLPYGAKWGFWTRDAGLVVLTLREMGYDAWLVALGDATTTVTESQPVLPISIEEMRSADWWTAQKPDAVVLHTWSAPRHDAIRQAARAATPRVIERLDTDGSRSARLFPKAYFMQAWGEFAVKLPTRRRWLAKPLGAAKTALFFALPAAMDLRMVASMRLVAGLIVESPVAAERTERMIEMYSKATQRICVIPPPIDDSGIRYTAKPKENRIIAVGRWGSPQKDFPMLRYVLRTFLQQNPDWQATVVGSGVPDIDRAAGKDAQEWRQRITFHEHLMHEQLGPEYSRAKIYLMVSRFESFCIAAAEALCCGCSVVGSSEVPSSYYFADKDSGSVAPARTTESFVETLEQEAACWANGARNPDDIASTWRNRAGKEAVSRSTLAFLKEVA